MLRMIIVLLLLLALSEFRVLWDNQRLAVIFLVDRSASVPARHQDAIIDFIRDSADYRDRERGDAVGVVSFGRTAGIERAPRAEGASVTFDDTVGHLQALFQAGRPIIGICAAGVLIRALAPLLRDKSTEPPVLALAVCAATTADAQIYTRRTASGTIEATNIPGAGYRLVYPGKGHLIHSKGFRVGSYRGQFDHIIGTLVKLVR